MRVRREVGHERIHEGRHHANAAAVQRVGKEEHRHAGGGADERGRGSPEQHTQGDEPNAVGQSLGVATSPTYFYDDLQLTPNVTFNVILFFLVTF